MIKKLAEEKEQKSELSKKQKMREERLKRKQMELSKMVKDLINDNKKLNSDKEVLESRLKESVVMLKSIKDPIEERSKVTFGTSCDEGGYSGRDFRQEKFKKIIKDIKNSNGKEQGETDRDLRDTSPGRKKRVKAESCRFDQRNFDLDFIGNKTQKEGSEFFISKKRVFKPSILESNNIETPEGLNYNGFGKEKSQKEKTVKFVKEEETLEEVNRGDAIRVLEDRSIRVEDRHYVPQDIIFSEQKSDPVFEVNRPKKRLGRRVRIFLKKRGKEETL